MEPNSNAVIPQSPAADNSKQTNGNGLRIATVVAAIVAACGIGFGVYGMLDSGQKAQQISNLETEITNKSQKITQLESEISQLSSKSEELLKPTIDTSEPEATTGDETAAITLESTLDENETRTVFKIGECTADGPSVKCPVDVNGKNALISYNSTDSLLRLTIPNE